MLAGLTDIDFSFLKFTRQLARHEAALRSQGKIEFRSGETLSVNGRLIEKFGISLFDHGSLQHRDITIALLNLLIGRRLSIDDPKADMLSKRINSNLEGLEKSLRVILDSQEGDDQKLMRAFSMSTWWLSVDQLKYAILKGGDLWSGIEPVRHLTSRSGDLIYDINTLQNLGKHTQSILNAAKKMDNRAIINF